MKSEEIIKIKLAELRKKASSLRQNLRQNDGQETVVRKDLHKTEGQIIGLTWCAK